MKGRITLVNVVSGLILQIMTIISGFIIPRIILSYFGSEVNGLVSSINQFLSYIALIEGGVTGVIAANLYKPLVENDLKKVSAVLVTAKQFYRRIGCLFCGYVVILSIVYPVAFEVAFDRLYVFSLTIILAIMLFVQYMFSLTLRTLLNADKKVYIVNFTQTIIVLLNIVLAFVSVTIYPSIHFLKLVNGLLFIIQPIVFGGYVRKHYDISWKENAENSLIRERWNGFAINIAAFIHHSTDITVLTMFASLKIVSVYTVYALVTNGLKAIVNSMVAGINPTVGQAYAKKDEALLNQKLDLCEYIVFSLVGSIFTVAALLITPFVLIYTSGVNDVEYGNVLFGYLLVLSEALYLIKLPHLNLAYSANKFKDITIPAYLEAIINIVVSVVLVRRYGIIGVAIGTIAAMTYRMAFHIYFTNKLLPARKQIIFYKKLGYTLVGSLIGFAICTWCFPMTSITIVNWIIHAAIYSILVGFVFLAISFMFYRKEMIYMKKYITKK